MSLRGNLIGKRIVGVIRDKMSSNNRTVTTHEGLVLEDARGRRSYLRWTTLEETNGADYGTELVYPGRAPRDQETAIDHDSRARVRPDPVGACRFGRGESQGDSQ